LFGVKAKARINFCAVFQAFNVTRITRIDRIIAENIKNSFGFCQSENPHLWTPMALSERNKIAMTEIFQRGKILKATDKTYL